MRDLTAGLKLHKDILIRSVGFGAAAVILCGALMIGSILRGPSPVPPSASIASGPDSKDQTRFVAARPSETQPASAMTNVTIWHPDKMENVAAADSLQAPSPTLAFPEQTAEWRTQDLTSVAVVDGRTFNAAGLTIRLAGLELPPSDQVCRTLDNRLEE